jgi:tetratricopeptide (TPR) repeat protein
MGGTIRTLFLTWVALGAWAQAAAQPASLHPAVEAALEHLYNLEYDQAERRVEARLAEQPHDLAALNTLASILLQHELYRRELLEAQVYAQGGEVYRQRPVPVRPEFERRLFGVLARGHAVADGHLARNPNDPEALYWKGLLHATRAIYHLSVTRSHRQAVGDARDARNLHVKILEQNPQSVDAQLLVGIYDYVAGSIPWYLKIFAAIAGHTGNRDRGMATIRRVTEQGSLARTDAMTFLAVLYYREKLYDHALRVLQHLERMYPRNHLLPQQMARAYKAMGDWKSAAETYETMLARHEVRTPGYEDIPLSRILFQAGEARQRQGDRAQALAHFERAAALDEDNINVFRAELSAAGIYVQMGRRADAHRSYSRVAKSVPDTGEGRAAREALKRLGDVPRAVAAGSG